MHVFLVLLVINDAFRTPSVGASGAGDKPSFETR
jgi:hypothetical protein